MRPPPRFNCSSAEVSDDCSSEVEGGSDSDSDSANDLLSK